MMMCVSLQVSVQWYHQTENRVQTQQTFDCRQLSLQLGKLKSFPQGNASFERQRLWKFEMPLLLHCMYVVSVRVVIHEGTWLLA